MRPVTALASDASATAEAERLLDTWHEFTSTHFLEPRFSATRKSARATILGSVYSQRDSATYGRDLRLPAAILFRFPNKCDSIVVVWWAMELILQSEILKYVVVIRCRGRLVSGDEVRALQLEAEKLTHLKKRIVLQMAEVNFIDSAGLGALVRLFGMLRFDGGGLKLCQLSPFVLQVLQVTNLLGVIPTYASEREAIEAFSEGPAPVEKAPQFLKRRIVCLDSSHDLLAYLKALLTRAGYEVFTTRNPSDARTLAVATGPRVVICGPGTPTSESAIETLRQCLPNLHVLLLPSDFSTAEASQAGKELVDRIRSTLADPG